MILSHGPWYFALHIIMSREKVLDMNDLSVLCLLLTNRGRLDH